MLHFLSLVSLVCSGLLVLSPSSTSIFFFFFFNDTATTEIYTLSLHDALPISWMSPMARVRPGTRNPVSRFAASRTLADRKSTRLNSSHQIISYAVFCLKKKKKQLKVAMWISRSVTAKANDTQRLFAALQLVRQ